jgi:hypothetical protein
VLVFENGFEMLSIVTLLVAGGRMSQDGQEFEEAGKPNLA